MALTQEQIAELKKQLSAQIQHIPHDKRAEAQKQIDSMSVDAMEEMLEEQKARAGIFRKIVSKEIETRIIDENSDAMAVLEIRPLSKGHTIIIPKKKINDKKEIPAGMKNLTNSVAEKIKSAMEAKDVKILTENKLGEIIMDIIPLYGKELDENKDREVASPEELDSVLKKIKQFQKIEAPKNKVIIKEDKKKDTEIVKLKRKIP